MKFLAIIFVSSLLIQKSYACTCAGYSDLNAYYESSDFVVKGHNYINDTIGDQVFANFVIEQTWKGTFLPDTFRFQSGYTYESSSVCMDNFDDRDYILFGYIHYHPVHNSDTLYEIGTCNTYLYNQEMADKLNFLMNPLSTPITSNLTYHRNSNTFYYGHEQLTNVSVFNLTIQKLPYNNSPLPMNKPLLIIANTPAGVIRKKMIIDES